MPGLVVVALIFLQRLEREYGEAGEEAVGADYDEEDGDEVERYRPHGVCDHDGDAVAYAEAHDANYDDEPVDARLLLAGLAAAQELNGPHASDADEVEDEREGNHQREEERGVHDGVQLHLKAESRGQTHEPVQQQRHELVEQYAEREAESYARQANIQALVDHYPRDIALAHAEHAVEAELLLPALHEEAVRVDEEDEAEERDERDAYAHEHLRVDLPVRRALAEAVEAGVEVERVEDVHRRAGADDRQQVGEIELPVALYAARGEAGVEAELTHLHHRPGSWPSACRKSARRTARRSARPGRAGGRPRRRAGRAPSARGPRP